MELSKTQKILLGLASGWPVVYVFLFMAFVFAMIAMSAGGAGGSGELDPIFGGGFVILMLVHMVTIFMTLGLTIFYIVHAVKNAKLDSNMRIIWIVLFFLGGIIAQPIYWYLQIWKDSPAASYGQLPPLTASNWVAQEQSRQGSYVPPNEPPDWR